MIVSRVVLAAVATVTMLLATPASAQEEQTLVVAMPPDFKLVFKDARPDGSVKITEFTPDGQTVDTWQQMITVQHFPKLAGADPAQFASRWAQHLLATCPRAEAARYPQDTVNGYLAVRLYVHMTECGGEPPESVLALVIKGLDAMHMVQHAWRPQPPTPEQLRAAMDDFDRVRLCAAGDAACAK